MYHVEYTPKRQCRVGISQHDTLTEAREAAISVRDGAQGHEYRTIIVWASNTATPERPVFVAKS